MPGGVENHGEGAGILGPGHESRRRCECSRMSAPSTSQGVWTSMPGFLADVLVDEVHVVLHRRRVHAGRRADLQLQHRAVIVDFLRRDAHLHAEESCEVHVPPGRYRRRSGRSARSGGTGCSGRQVRQGAPPWASSARYRRAARRESSPPCFTYLKYRRRKISLRNSGPVDFVAPAGFIDVAGVGAGLATARSAPW